MSEVTCWNYKCKYGKKHKCSKQKITLDRHGKCEMHEEE